MTVYIILTIAGGDVGPFDLYSDLDGYTSPFETGISRAQLVSGYLSVVVPDGTTSIKVQSTGVCDNYIIFQIILPTTTSTTTGEPTTTTTTATPTTTTTTTTACIYWEVVDCDTSNHYCIDPTDCTFEVGDVVQYQIGVPGAGLIRCATIIDCCVGPPDATINGCTTRTCGDEIHCNIEPPA